jgi:hypothetical protein
MISLSKNTAEYTSEEIQFLWETPEGFSRFAGGGLNYIVGTKGTGKSTIAEYIKINFEKNTNKKVLILRPTFDGGVWWNNLLENTFSLNQVSHSLRSAFIHATIELIVLAFLVYELKCFNNIKFRAVTFLIVLLNKLSSRQKRFTKLPTSFDEFRIKLSELIIRKSSDAINIVEAEIRSIFFKNAWKSIKDFLSRKQIKVFLIIDDVDEMGFAFSTTEILLIKELKKFVYNKNAEFIQHKIPLEIILTVPIEIWRETRDYNDDKLQPRVYYLKWEDNRKMKNIINKRIAIELNIKKKKRDSLTEKFSASDRHTWLSLFRETLYNKRGQKEDTFIYLLRHTFYTPRHMLDMTAALINNLLEKYDQDVRDVIKNISESEWHNIVQRTVEDKSYELATNRITLWGELWHNIKIIEKILECFRKTPNIWEFTKFKDHLNTKLKIIPELTINEATSMLYKIGFIGYVYKEFDDSNLYKMAFSYINYDFSTSYLSDFIVISPVFYDKYQITPIGDKIILPHGHIDLSNI